MVGWMDDWMDGDSCYWSLGEEENFKMIKYLRGGSWW